MKPKNFPSVLTGPCIIKELATDKKYIKNSCQESKSSKITLLSQLTVNKLKKATTALFYMRYFLNLFQDSNKVDQKNKR